MNQYITVRMLSVHLTAGHRNTASTIISDQFMTDVILGRARRQPEPLPGLQLHLVG